MNPIPKRDVSGHSHLHVKESQKTSITVPYFTRFARWGILAALVLMLIACTPAAPESSPTEAPAVEEPADGPPPAPEPTTAPNVTETRKITDAAGNEVEIPAHPQRVVALSERDMDAALLLGANVVGVVNGRGAQTPPAYLQPLIGPEVVVVGPFSSPNAEAILNLNPDLILIGGLFPDLEALVPSFQEIAPVVITFNAGDDWRTAFRGAANALNQTAEAEAWLTAFDERVTSLAATIPAGTEISIVRFNPDGPVIMSPMSFASVLASEVGLTRPEAQMGIEGPGHGDTISEEALQTLEADFLFVGALNPEGTGVLETALENPLYGALNVFQKDAYAVVDGAVWTTLGGPLAAETILNDIEAAFAKTDAANGDAETAFPLTIEHAFGSTTLETVPERIVSVGYIDQDPLIALGVNLLAGRYWFGDTESIVFPWAKDDLQGEEPMVLNMPFGELNYELILSLDPDVIIAVSSGILESEYQLLSEIAPTIAQSGAYDNFGMPWQEATQLIGDAVGKSKEAAAIVADVQALFDEAVAAHPEFVGKEIVVAGGRNEAGNYFFFSAQDARTRFFTDLGFAAPADLDELTGDSFYTEISGERLDLLDRDLIIFSQASYLPEGADTILNDPLLAQLDAIKEGRFIILTEEIDAAFSASSVLSLPYALEQLVPQLAAALAGN
ncbi:MAG: hypothetical protein Fur0022_47970 [Anaerolineales bacterium]